MTGSMMALMTFPVSSKTGPEELKQANYALQSLPKGFKILKGGAHLRVSKGHGTHGHS